MKKVMECSTCYYWGINEFGKFYCPSVKTEWRKRDICDKLLWSVEMKIKKKSSKEDVLLFVDRDFYCKHYSKNKEEKE